MYFFNIELYFFNSILSGVFFLFFVVMYLDVPDIPVVLCSVHSKITCILLPFFAMIKTFFGRQTYEERIYFTTLWQEIKQTFSLFSFLHVSAVLSTHLKQRIGKLSKRTHLHRIHQHFKHIPAFNHRFFKIE